MALPDKVVPANDRFLIRMCIMGTGGADLPTPDASSSVISLAAASGLAILSDGITGLTVPTGGISGADGVVDAVGYGAKVTSFEGARKATAGTGATSYARNASGTDATGHVPTGTVQVLSGTKVVGTAALSNGSAVLTTARWTRVGSSKLAVSYLGDPGAQPSTGSVTVKVVKQTPTIRTTAPKIVKRKSAPTVKVVLTGVNTLVDGKVTFVCSGRSVTQKIVNGRVRLKLAKLTKTTRVTVTYAGSAIFNSVTKRLRIVVTK